MKRKGVSKGTFFKNFSFGSQPSSKHLLLLHLQTLHVYTYTVYTHTQTQCWFILFDNHKNIQQHNRAYKSLLVSCFASIAPSVWYLVSILNRSNKSWKKALKSRLVAARPIDQFHAYKTCSAQQFM